MLHLDGSVKDDKELDACSEHELSCEFYTSCSRLANLLLNCETGGFYLGGESGTIILLSVKFLSMDNDDFFRLPFAKKWRKHSETLGSVMLIFCHFMIASDSPGE